MCLHARAHEEEGKSHSVLMPAAAHGALWRCQTDATDALQPKGVEHSKLYVHRLRFIIFAVLPIRVLHYTKEA